MFAGVMFAIGVILGGYWRSLSPADFLEWFSRNNVFIMRAIPFVALPTFIGLGGSLWLGWNSGRGFSLKPIFLKPYLL